jgi:hypothetical protein
MAKWVELERSHAMARHKNADWNLSNPAKTWEEVNAALLMDIRDELQGVRAELKQLNNLLHCENFQRIPRKLDRISANTHRTKQERQQALKA